MCKQHARESSVGKRQNLIPEPGDLCICENYSLHLSRTNILISLIQVSLCKTCVFLGCLEPLTYHTALKIQEQRLLLSCPSFFFGFPLKLRMRRAMSIVVPRPNYPTPAAQAPALSLQLCSQALLNSPQQAPPSLGRKSGRVSRVNSALSRGGGSGKAPGGAA